MKWIVPALAFLFISGCCSCDTDTTSTSRKPSSTTALVAEDFEVGKDDQAFAEMIAGLDLEDPKYNFEYKASSTSVGFKVAVDITNDKGEKETDKLGKFVPENSANNVEAQTVSYYLGEFLYMKDLVVPSAYYTIGTKALARFKAMLHCEKEKGQHKDNCVKILAAMNKNPNSMLGSFTEHVSNELEVPNMIANGKVNGTINAKNPLVQFLNAANPEPSADKKISLGISWVVDKKKVIPQESELELARQLSKIMVLDVLTGQWDRFSGGNIQAIYKKKKGVVQFLSIDNGGASMSGHIYWAYATFLSRFDAGQIQRVERLAALLTDNKEETAKALQLKSDAKTLLNRCNTILEMAKASQAKYGDKAFFPAPVAAAK